MPFWRRRTASFRHQLVAGRDGNPTAGAGGAVGRAARLPASLRYFARGYSYAQAIEPPEGTQAVDEELASNPLEAYFESHTEGPGLWKWRHYFEIYHRHLARFRGQPVRMVEIGVFGGGSLGMWREYFGADTHIYGVDIDPSCRELAGPGVEIFIGDQSDPAFWRSFLESGPRIDVVLDDGGHTPAQQMVTLECLLPAIRPGGVYICEDINGGFQPFHAFVDGLTHPLSAVGFGNHRPRTALQGQVASVHRYPLVTVIEKPPADAPPFENARRGTLWPTQRRRKEEQTVLQSQD
jgi:cephalosporin hydroxylase